MTMTDKVATDKMTLAGTVVLGEGMVITMTRIKDLMTTGEAGEIDDNKAAMAGVMATVDNRGEAMAGVMTMGANRREDMAGTMTTGAGGENMVMSHPDTTAATMKNKESMAVVRKVMVRNVDMRVVMKVTARSAAMRVVRKATVRSADMRVVRKVTVRGADMRVVRKAMVRNTAMRAALAKAMGEAPVEVMEEGMEAAPLPSIKMKSCAIPSNMAILTILTISLKPCLS